MALVHRASVTGPSSAVYVGHAAVATAPPAAPLATLPAQPTGNGNGNGAAPAAAPDLEAAAVPTAPPAAAPAALPPQPNGNGSGAAPAAAPEQEAAAVPSKPASPLAVLTAFGIVGVGTLVAFVLWKTNHTGTPFKIGNQTSAYAGATAFAAAVERFLEPFSQLLPGGRRARAEYERLIAGLANRQPGVDLEKIAAAKARMDHSTANRAVLLWGLATGLATVVAALGGFYFLHMIAADGWTPSGIPLWVDALATGLIVGTGTKPLHDLITKLQNARTAVTKS